MSSVDHHRRVSLELMTTTPANDDDDGREFTELIESFKLDKLMTTTTSQHLQCGFPSAHWKSLVDCTGLEHDFNDEKQKMTRFYIKSQESIKAAVNA